MKDRTPDGRIEGFTGGCKTIGSEHVMVWEGCTYKASYVNTAVANTASVNILIQVPATLSLMHINHNTFKTTGAPFGIGVYEGPTFSAAGTAITPYNINRLSSNTSLVTITHTPTLTDDGTQIEADLIVGDKSAGGDIEGYSEHFVFGPGNFLFRATNNSGQEKQLAFRMAYFELAA